MRMACQMEQCRKSAAPPPPPCACAPPAPCAPCSAPAPCAPPAPGAPCAPMPGGPVPLAKNLDNVILQQKASGCFNQRALELLDIPDSAKAARPAQLPDGIDAKLAEDIWVTLLVLVGLQRKFDDKKSEWNFIAKKSEKWASTKLGAAYDAWKAAAEAAY